jgi:flagellar basal-body rod modification protein FlgD
VIETIGTTAEAQATMTDSLLENDDLGKDAFLKLLLAQLQNQDPMEPVKSQDFVAQLAQFSSLEQLTSINNAVSGGKNAEATAELRQAIESNTAVGLMGKQVEIPTETLTYTGNTSVEIGYNLTGPANKVDLQIYDTEGNLVRTLTQFSPTEGNGSISWDGVSSQGQAQPAGNYHIVPTAVNGQGNSVIVSASLTGEVTGVRYQDGKPILVLNGGEAPLSGVARIF